MPQPRTVQLPLNTEISYSIDNRDSDSPNTVLTDYYQVITSYTRTYNYSYMYIIISKDIDKAS